MRPIRAAVGGGGVSVDGCDVGGTGEVAVSAGVASGDGAVQAVRANSIAAEIMTACQLCFTGLPQKSGYVRQVKSKYGASGEKGNDMKDRVGDQCKQG